MRAEAEIAQKLNQIEEDLSSLKSMVVHIAQVPKKNVKLKGLLKGIAVSEKDIADARKSLFRAGG